VTPRDGLVLAACLATVWGGLRPGKVSAAPQSWAVAQEDHGDAFTERVYVGVAAFQRDVAPWQPGYAQAQARLDRISSARRRALPDDRGGWRAGPVEAR